MSKPSNTTPEISSQLRHELRTPLGQIIGYADLLMEEWADSGSTSLLADLERIRGAGQRLLALVEAHAPAGAASSVTPAPASAPEISGTLPPGSPASLAANTSGGNILVVDDNPDNRALLTRRLEQQGHHCHTVGSGAEALDLLAYRPFDVVLLDVMMPEMDGYQVLKRIKSAPATRTTPVVMISAVEDIESVVRCIEMGAADYLPKPFNPVLLRARVDACLKDKRQHDREARLYQKLQEKYRRERNIADALQRPLLRENAPDAFPHLEVATLYEAALTEAQVGGDLFDAFALPGGKVALVIADASGKGLTAAARAFQLKYALRAYAREFAEDPAGVVTHLNAFLCDAVPDTAAPECSFVCLAFAVIDSQTGEGQVVPAGCEPPLLIRAQGSPPEALEGFGMPLGITADLPYQDFPIHLAPGDSLVLCTDGITEARCGKDFLGYEGFAALAARAATSEPTLRAMARGILEGARGFGRGTLHDDACLLIARRR